MVGKIHKNFCLILIFVIRFLINLIIYFIISNLLSACSKNRAQLWNGCNEHCGFDFDEVDMKTNECQLVYSRDTCQHQTTKPIIKSKICKVPIRYPHSFNILNASLPQGIMLEIYCYFQIQLLPTFGDQEFPFFYKLLICFVLQHDMTLHDVSFLC